MKSEFRGLVGDVGGTNARFALVDVDGHIRHPKAYAAKDFATLNEVVATYLQATVGRKRPTRAVIAVAGPVVDGEIEFTNLDWRISEAELLVAFEFEAIRLINDFAAQALAAPVLDEDDLKRIGPKLRGADGGPIAVLGPGTGFGVAALVRSPRDAAVATEGGHASFAPCDELEVEILKRLRATHARVSIERVLSGPGLLSLYRAMADIEGQPALHGDEKAMVDAARTGEALPLAAARRFCAILGAVAGDITLTIGARGGVYIAGGIAPRMLDWLNEGEFRARFEDKGRLAGYMAEIPTSVITHPYTALVGAARALEDFERIII